MSGPIIPRGALNTLALRQLAQVATPQPDPTSVSRRWGVVMNTGTNTVDVAIGGVTVTGLAYMSTYTPVVGETVLVDIVTTDMVVVGAVAPCRNQNLAVNGTLTVLGSSRLTSLTTNSLAVTGNATIGGTLGVTGLLTASGGILIPTGFDVTLTDAPAVGTDAANKTYVDTKASIAGDLGGTAASPTVTSGAHHTHTSSQISDAASANTASKVVIRDASARAQFADPSAAQDAATKSYVDSYTNSAPSGKMWRTAGFMGAMTINTNYTAQFDTARTAGGFTFTNGGTPSVAASTYLTLPSDGFYNIDGQTYTSGGSVTGTCIWTVYRTRSAVGDQQLAMASDVKTDSDDVFSALNNHWVPLKSGDKIWIQIIAPLASNLNPYGSTEGYGMHLTVRYVAPLNGATPL